MTRYPTLASCHKILFPFIRRWMASSEPVPRYEDERSGVQYVEGIFALMERDEYPDHLAKAAYLFCSIVDGHHFSNGNKRLGVALLTYFLLINGYKISAPELHTMREALTDAFPKLIWEDVAAFQFPHEYFFYHLAIIIADRRQKGKLTFQQEQSAVKDLLKVIVVR